MRRRDFVARQVPPGASSSAAMVVLVEAVADDLRRVAADDGVGRHVLGHDGMGRDHRAVADRHARHDRSRRSRATRRGRWSRRRGAYDNPRVCGRRRPESRKAENGIGRAPVDAMVAAEQDLDLVGDRAIAPDGQLLARLGKAHLGPAVGELADRRSRSGRRCGRDGARVWLCGLRQFFRRCRSSSGHQPRSRTAIDGRGAKRAQGPTGLVQVRARSVGDGRQHLAGSEIGCAVLPSVSAPRKARDPADQAARQPARPGAGLFAGRRRPLRGDRRRPGDRPPTHLAPEPRGGDLQRHGGAGPRRYRPARLQAGDGRQGGPVQEVRRHRRLRHRGRRERTSTSSSR